MKKVVISVLSMLMGAAIGAGIVGKVQTKRLEDLWKKSDKHMALFLMSNQWIKIKQEGKNLIEYFDKNGYKRIAIYGMSYVGETLIDELRNTGIEVVYAIDQKADSIYADVDIVTIEDNLQPVDAIVVTAITFFDQIEEKLSQKIDCPVISLEDILYEI